MLLMLQNRNLSAVEVRNLVAEVRNMHAGMQEAQWQEHGPELTRQQRVEKRTRSTIGIWCSAAKFFSQMSPDFVYVLQMIVTELINSGP